MRLPLKVRITIGVLIAIIAVLATIVFGVLDLPPIQDRLWRRHSDTYVYVYGMEHSYTIEQLEEQAPIRSKITIVPIQFPEGVSSVEDNQVPMWFFNWTYSDDEKLYIVTANNKGDGVARNTKVDIDFTPNSISSVEINNEERVKIISGGNPLGTRIVFEIDELLPDELQYIEILVHGKSVESLDVWSESEDTIDNVFILDISIEPDKDAVSPFS